MYLEYFPLNIKKLSRGGSDFDGTNGDILVSYQFQIVVGAQNANDDNGRTSGIVKWIKQFILYIN